ncbi:RraA family protein [Virgibacillus sp. W0181]|uniref:RraA family protein n=1 Tax=Virgibacillus sp. W0181 TaxID=3391581 RepID=UPI003F47B233
MDIGNRIITDVKRPNKEVVNQFKNVPVSNISDAMGRMYSLSSRIKPFNSSYLLGTAITVKSRTADNLLFQKALDLAKPGDIIIVDTQGDTINAVAGEIMVEYAKRKRLAGFLIDGAIRDAKKIRESSFPVFASGISANGPYKSGPGEINIPISCGGIVINPGDIIVGDEDGVVAITPKFVDCILKKINAIAKEEKKKLKDIELGVSNREWVNDLLIERGYDISH